MRLLGLPSESEGRDWNRLSKRIDTFIESEGLDLAEETVLIHSGAKGTTVFRPVIGGLRELTAPWILRDRTARNVEMTKLQAENWDDLEDEINALRAKNKSGEFTLMLKRRMEGELVLSAQVFFSLF